MPINLYDAHRQWAIRPADERFSSLEELFSFTSERKNASRQQVRPLDRIVLDVTPEGAVAMNGQSDQALLTNWTFGQLCRSVGAPAGYLRTLPADMARDCLQYGVKNSDQRCKLLLREESLEADEQSSLWASALTSESYGRIWDADVVESLMQAVDGSSWHVPLAYSNNESDARGLYASDRDMFAFMVNDDNPVEIGNVKLGRGFFCWNSETGASTFGLTTFLYNYVCRNHIVWGAEQVNELKIIHKSQAPDRFYKNALPILNRFVENQGLDENIKTTIGQAMNHEVGNTINEVLDWFKAKPFTRREITDAWDTGLDEGEDVRTLWAWSKDSQLMPEMFLTLIKG